MYTIIWTINAYSIWFVGETRHMLLPISASLKWFIFFENQMHKIFIKKHTGSGWYIATY